MAGVNRDEGQYSEFGWEMTVPTFIANVQMFDDMYHNIDVERVADFYLKTVDPSDGRAVSRAFGEFIGDLLVKCPTYTFAKRMARYQRPVYYYEFGYMSPVYGRQSGCDVDRQGICHSQELPFVFGVPLLEPDAGYTPDDQFFSRHVINLWTNFAKYGY